MILVLDITLSLEFWRKVYPTGRTPATAFPIAFSDKALCAYSMSDVWSLAPSWVTAELLEPLDGKIHVLAFDRSLRRASKRHFTHTWSHRIPDGSFYDFGNSVYVASPGFIFLSSASFLNTFALMALAAELCGLYSFDGREQRGFRKRSAPLIPLEQLQMYLDGAKGCPGQNKAQQALRFIAPHSASPMETLDYLALSLPYRLGGYGIAGLSMNREVHLTSKAMHIAQRRTCYLDMSPEHPLLDIEHHGKLDHSSQEDIDSDRARVNGLKEMGYEVIELTSQQVSDLLTFEYIALRIAKLVGKRINVAKCGPIPQRLELRRELYKWNRLSGNLLYYRSQLQ